MPPRRRPSTHPKDRVYGPLRYSSQRPANMGDVKRAIRVNNKQTQEMKYNNSNTVFSSLVSYNGSLEDLTNIVRGDADTNRDGDRLLPISLRFSYVLYGETYSSVFRILIFRWKPDSVPTVGDVLFTTGSGYAVTCDYQHDQRNQFEILYDKKHTVSNNGGSELVVVTKSLKMAKKQVDYTAGGTSGSNKIWAIAISDRSLATSGTIAMTYRLNFTDS